MAKKVAQIRYYGDESNQNYPSGLNKKSLRKGSTFYNYKPIKQLGIQTMPGVKFYLNGSIEPVIVGSTGIYELNVENLANITSLSFDYTSLSMIENSETAYLIIDLLYEKEGE